MGEESGGKAKRDDQAKDEVSGGADKAPVKAPTEEPDKLGALARADSSAPVAGSTGEQRIEDSLLIVQHSFHWFNEAAQQKIDGLRSDLKQEDEPDWLSQIASGLLEVALGAGAAAAGVRLVEAVGSIGGEAGEEFIKVLFEGGVNAGVAAGRAKLGAGRDGHVIDPFIDAQKEGVWAAQMANQQQFITVDRHKVRSVNEAEKLTAACSKANILEAAGKQYDATRDAWLSYLAQARYGAAGVHEGYVHVGPTKTNMMTEESRRKINRSAPGFLPADAPDLEDAMMGRAPGVLTVLAELPRIGGYLMWGKPTAHGVLNGVNDKMRRQYEGVALSEMHIPRHVVATVEGAPDFTLNIDEEGKQCNNLGRKERTWLAARATVGHPENASKSEWERSEEGRRLLLQELAPRPVKEHSPWG